MQEHRAPSQLRMCVDSMAGQWDNPCTEAPHPPSRYRPLALGLRLLAGWLLLQQPLLQVGPITWKPPASAAAAVSVVPGAPGSTR